MIKISEVHFGHKEMDLSGTATEVGGEIQMSPLEPDIGWTLNAKLSGVDLSYCGLSGT